MGKKVKIRLLNFRRRLKEKPALLFLAIICGIALVAAPIAAADTYQQQINSLNNQSAKDESDVNSLQLQATSYQDAISKLQTQIATIQQAIAASQAQENKLQSEIEQTQNKLNHEKQILSADIKAMYVAGQMSTIEELATSKTLSDFVDAETYRNAVQSQVQNTLVQVSDLENQLQTKKTQVDQLLQVQQAQNASLSSDEQQEQHLLSYNQTQQNQYNQQIEANQSKVASLEAAQAAANAAISQSVHVPPSGGSGGACDDGEGNGGYPMAWCNAPQDSITTPGDFPNRECTSFAYWYFTSMEGQTGFSVSGNAGWWWETSNYASTPWNSSVRDGAIGIWPSDVTNPPVQTQDGDYYGHVMIVLGLPGQTYEGTYVPSGDVLVMSMNIDYYGHFGYSLWPVDDLMFINPR